MKVKANKISTLILVLALVSGITEAQNVVMELYTQGQQYAVINGDHFWVASAPNDTAIFGESPMENWDSISSGLAIMRSNALDGYVLGEWGCYSNWPYNPRPASAWYTVPTNGNDTVYIKFRYSKYCPPLASIEIYINAQYAGLWFPNINTYSWNTFTYSEYIPVIIPPLPTVFSGPDDTICEDQIYYLSAASASNYTTLSWTTSGDGTFSDATILNPNYTPGALDIQNTGVELSLEASNGFTSASDSMHLMIEQNATAYAGIDDTVSAQVPYLLSYAQATNYETLGWSTSGDGTFDNSTILNPTYTPGVNDPGTLVQLTLVASPSTPCSESASDYMNLYCEPSSSSAYYHSLQQFDDDVDRIKRYSNSFGGDAGIMNGDPANPQIGIDWDTSNTRTGYGRSLELNYGPLNSWSMYIESFKQRWYDSTTSFDLASLFNDYIDPAFMNRHIDSVVFYYLLQSADNLSLKLELHDAEDGVSQTTVTLYPEEFTWQRIAVALSQFQGNFNMHKAKFMGFTFADYPSNIGESGTLRLDDLYLVENSFTKPVFANDIAMLKYLNKVNFRNFWMAVDPASGFALDRHIWQDLISVDAIGFQLSAYVIAHKNNWINPQLIEARVEKILDFLLHVCQHGDSTSIQANPLAYATVDGNWAHFLDSETLARKDTNTEFSLFTNALLVSGIITVKEYFSNNSNIQTWSDSLYRMTDWNFLLRSDSLMYYAWCPEKGYSEYFTDFWTEELDLAMLLAISSPDPAHRLPFNPYNASGYRKFCCELYDDPYVYSASGSNFTYYFLQMYAKYSDKNQSERFENAKSALLADISYCHDSLTYLNYDSRIFGITACEGPDSAGVDPAGNNISNYHAYGFTCKLDTVNKPNGTIAVYGSASSILWIPDEGISCLRYYYNELDSLFINDYGYAFWSPIFGFPDAFHLKPDESKDSLIHLNFNGPFISVPRFGISIGPMLICTDAFISELENTVSVRDLFSNSPEIKDNLIEFENLLCHSPVFINDEENTKETNLYLYPNPTTGTVYLYASAFYSYSVYNTLGSLISQGSIDDNKFDLSGLERGMYFIVLNSDQSQATQRIVKL